jgi:AbrB family looped-hinge helix DNA binding protein
MINGMKTTIDSAGRIVIPRDIRVAAGLEPGTPVEIAIVEGVVSIEPAPAPVRIVKRGRLRVAVADESSEVLTQGQVNATREMLRRGK